MNETGIGQESKHMPDLSIEAPRDDRAGAVMLDRSVESNPRSKLSHRLKPLRFLWIIIGGIVIAETISMIIITNIERLTPVQEIILDTIVLVILAFPVVYIFSYHPLLAQYRRSQLAEQALAKSHADLENRIEERTKELNIALQSSRQRQAEVEALLKSARAVLENKEFSQTARTIFETCKDLIGANAGYVALEKGDYNEAIFLDPGADLCLVDPTLPMPIRGLRAEAYASGKIVFDNNFPASENSKYLPDGHAELENVMFSPLTVDQRVVGLLGLANKPGGFNEQDTIMATAFGELAAIALMNSWAAQKILRARDELENRVVERTRALEEMNEALRAEVMERKWAETRLEQQNKILLALNAASMSMTQSLELETVLATLLESLHRLIPFDCAYIVLVENEDRLIIHNFKFAAAFEDLQDVIGCSVESSAVPYVQELLRTQTRIQISDTSKYPNWRHICGLDDVRSWLGLPLVAGGRIIGFIGMDKIQPEYFSEKHIQIIESFIGQAAIAIQNAWLYEQVRAGRERLQILSRRLVEVQESERRYIANELHDEAGQALAALTVHLSMVDQASDQPEVIKAEVAEMERTLNNVQEELHRLAMSLHPASLDYLGLIAAIRQHIEAFSEKHNLEVAFEVVDFGHRLPADVESTLYRIVQESLTNVARHAQATKADILLSDRGEKLILVVEDNGIGFDMEKAMEKKRLGLNSIRERVEMLNGKLVVESLPGKGTTLVVEVPNVNSNSRR